jgi:hypothetical protein
LLFADSLRNQPFYAQNPVHPVSERNRDVSPIEARQFCSVEKSGRKIPLMVGDETPRWPVPSYIPNGSAPLIPTHRCPGKLP